LVCPDCRSKVPGASRNPTGLEPSPFEPSAEVPPELASHAKLTILRELGRGGMGVVYLARQTVMDRQVVIKVINEAVLDNPDTLERFRREVRAAAKLSHPNIVIAHDPEQAGNLHLLVMEYVEGKDLARMVKTEGPLPVVRACNYARQAALGLLHAHERGMVHRDIKPHNLMVTPNGEVNILDFGPAKMVSENRPKQALTAMGAYMGTPAHSAPEQATDASKADIRADLYSLGSTLYFLLAGRPPYREKTQVLTMLAHLEKEPVPLPELRRDVPEELWRVVACLLAKRPAKRYQKPIDAARDLLPFCKAGPRGLARWPPGHQPAAGRQGRAGQVCVVGRTLCHQAAPAASDSCPRAPSVPDPPLGRAGGGGSGWLGPCRRPGGRHRQPAPPAGRQPCGRRPGTACRRGASPRPATGHGSSPSRRRAESGAEGGHTAGPARSPQTGRHAHHRLERDRPRGAFVRVA
jgi:tRNA A-37 threonylcarbamoyl transferase component Bud32